MYATYVNDTFWVVEDKVNAVYEGSMPVVTGTANMSKH